VIILTIRHTVENKPGVVALAMSSGLLLLSEPRETVVDITGWQQNGQPRLLELLPLLGSLIISFEISN